MLATVKPRLEPAAIRAGADFSSLSATTTVGVAFGVPVRRTERLSIIPTATLAYHHVHTLTEVIGPESDQSGYVTTVQAGSFTRPGS